MNCSHAGMGCNCQPGDPGIATPGYARHRRHVDAGDLDALRQVNAWLRDGVPQCHVRYSDGEFLSMMGYAGHNCDGQALQGGLGEELWESLQSIKNDRFPHVLVGGDWRRPPETWDYLQENNFVDTIPWCPSQVFVNGIVSGDTMEFLKLVRDSPGQKYLVSNVSVGMAAPSLRAHTLTIPRHDAWGSMVKIERSLRYEIESGGIVLYAAGLGCKPTIYELFRSCPGTTHIDVGCLFDGAAGILSRGWLNVKPPDERLIEYNTRYVPWLLGNA